MHTIKLGDKMNIFVITLLQYMGGTSKLLPAAKCTEFQCHLLPVFFACHIHAHVERYEVCGVFLTE